MHVWIGINVVSTLFLASRAIIFMPGLSEISNTWQVLNTAEKATKGKEKSVEDQPEALLTQHAGSLT